MAKKRKKAAKKVPKKASASGLPAALTGLELHDLRMIECESKIEIHDNKPPSKTSISVEIGGATRTDGLVAVLVKAMIEGKPEDGSDTSLLRIRVVHECLYRANTLPDSEESMSPFLGIGVLAAWPYTRETVASLTSRMGLPSLRLPIIRADLETGTVSVINK